MALPGTPSEQPKPSEEAEKTQQEVVSKTEYETALKTAQEQQVKFKEEIDKLKMQLLDNDYLEYKEKKAAASTKEKSLPKTGNEQEDLRAAIDAMQKRLDRQQQVQDALLADIELKELERTNPDYIEYKEDMIKIYEADPNTNLTLSQALAIARDNKRSAAKTSSTNTNEKPSNSMPGSSLNKSKSFKTDYDAGQDAWEQIKAKHGLTSDVI